MLLRRRVIPAPSSSANYLTSLHPRINTVPSAELASLKQSSTGTDPAVQLAKKFSYRPVPKLYGGAEAHTRP